MVNKIKEYLDAIQIGFSATFKAWFNRWMLLILVVGYIFFWFLPQPGLFLRIDDKAFYGFFKADENIKESFYSGNVLEYSRLILNKFSSVPLSFLLMFLAQSVIFSNAVFKFKSKTTNETIVLAKEEKD